MNEADMGIVFTKVLLNYNSDMNPPNSHCILLSHCRNAASSYMLYLSEQVIIRNSAR